MESTSPSPRRGPGRPKGLPRTGGRQKGTPNRTTTAQRDLIITKYQPVEFLGRVMLGQRIRTGPQAGPGKVAFAYPSLEQRIKAAELLVRKVLPDLSASEVTGKDGEPLVPPSRPIDDGAFRGALVALWREAVA
jgi:hypothetical protein